MFMVSIIYSLLIIIQECMHVKTTDILYVQCIHHKLVYHKLGLYCCSIVINFKRSELHLN